MHCPDSNTLQPISDELAKKFADPNATLTPVERVQRDWTRFEEGEGIVIKGVLFRVHEIGESRMVLKLVKK
jgi:hypothetical protein